MALTRGYGGLPAALCLDGQTQRVLPSRYDEKNGHYINLPESMVPSRDLGLRCPVGSVEYHVVAHIAWR